VDGGPPPLARCRDLRFYINRVGFDQLGPERAAVLNAVATRFTLPPQEVDALIAAGGDALRTSALFREFLASLAPAPRPVPSARVADTILAAAP
jgi:NTE family protein